MPDIKQVLYDIERCTCHVPDACRDCSKYRGIDGLRCMEELMTDAYTLLKEQEAKTVLDMDKRPVIQFKAMSGFCPKCCHTLIYGMNKHFCGNCGQEVKWE